MAFFAKYTFNKKVFFIKNARYSEFANKLISNNIISNNSISKIKPYFIDSLRLLEIVFYLFPNFSLYALGENPRFVIGNKKDFVYIVFYLFNFLA